MFMLYIMILEPPPRIELGTSSFAYTSVFKKWYLRTRLYLTHIQMNVASLVSRSGPFRNITESATVLTTLWLLTVIRVIQMFCFQNTGQEAKATYHGCALPTELRWHVWLRPQVINRTNDNITRLCIRKYVTICLSFGLLAHRFINSIQTQQNRSSCFDLDILRERRDVVTDNFLLKISATPPRSQATPAFKSLHALAEIQKPPEKLGGSCILRERRDLNPQPPPWQGGALTSWATPATQK